jgi:GT2 family glycosyltransferase
MISLPFVVVVTLNWNGQSFLKDCVDSILASDYTNLHLIVVDNGSTDASVELITGHYGSNVRVTLLLNKENLGYSRGMDIGLETGFGALKADYCLVMNNDTILDPMAVSSLVKVAQTDDSIAFVTGKVYYFDQPETFQTVGKKSHPVLVCGGHIGRGEKDVGQYDIDRELDFCDDIFWLVSKQAYDRLGGYDPEFFLQAEDFDWQLRAKKAGLKIMYAHQAKLWHRESMAIGKTSPLKAYYDARNPIIAVLKNCDPMIARGYWNTRVYKNMIPAIFKGALKGEYRISKSMLKGLLSAWNWKHNHRQTQMK